MTSPIEAKNSWNSCALHKPVRRRFLYIRIDDVRARECFELISMETRQIKGHLRHLFLLLSRPMMCSLFSLQRQWPMILFSFCCGWWCARTYIYFILYILIPNGETRYSLNAGFFLPRAHGTRPRRRGDFKDALHLVQPVTPLFLIIAQIRGCSESHACTRIQNINACVWGWFSAKHTQGAPA